MFMQPISYFRRIRAGRALSLVIMLALLFSPFRYVSPVAVAPVAIADEGQPVQMKIQPLLLEKAAEDPTALVDVIVQQRKRDTRAEALVAQLGGVVTKDLRLIGAFAAQIPAGKLLELAQAANVRWISLDAPMMSASVNPAPDSSAAGAPVLGYTGSVALATGQEAAQAAAAPMGASIAVTSQISQSSDDAEEEGPNGANLGPGSVYLNSTDLELVDDLEPLSSGTQTIGLRFNSIAIPPGARITNAAIRFRAVAADSPNTNTNATKLVIRGQAADNPTSFKGTTRYDVSARPRTGAAVTWAPSSWTVGSYYDTPDLAIVAQEIVNRPGWNSGNSMVFVVTGSGSRSAESWDNSGTNPPKLAISYTLDTSPTPIPSPTPVPTPAPTPAPATNPVFVTWASDFGATGSAANSLTADFNSSAIAAGSTVWFSAVLKPSGLGATPVTMRFLDAKIRFSAGGQPYELAVPDGSVLYSPTATAATTAFDAVSGTWLTTVPSSYTSEAFVTGVAFPVTTALPASIKDVTWTGRFTIDTPGVSAKWKWGAAVYSNFTGYSALGVKPITGDKLNPYANNDKAGTPENFKTSVVKGARGNGGSDYTGSWCGETTAKLTFEAREALVDSPVGPNDVFTYGSRVIESLAGFEPEISPGYAIQKVEAVLQAYVPAPLGHDFTLKLYVGGSSTSVSVKREFFNAYVGSLNAGPLYIDLTGLRSWQWADLGAGLELVIDQSGLSAAETVYYDAVGLRVTSAPGTDPTEDNLPAPNSLPKAAIDTSELLNAFNFAVRATDVWNEGPSYLQGQNMTVAMVDSGIGKNKDLEKRLEKSINFNSEYHDAKDRYGHGTFVASLIAGNGQNSAGKRMGIAPNANLLSVRVSNDVGMSQESDVVAALQWLYENRDRYTVRVVNLSLNSSVLQSYHTSPLAAAVEILWFNGIVVVVSAGNNGTANVYPPANDPFVITVGAVDDLGTRTIADDVMATFSAYGITQEGHAKPDLVAPGKNIVAYLPSNNKLTMGQQHPSFVVDKDYFRMSGTSMSAPMVAGAIALLLQDEPGLTPDQVKYRLKATANKSWSGYDAARAGAGYLDVYAAVHGTTTQRANLGNAPQQMLAKMALIALWASNKGGIVDWGSVNWDSVNWDSVNWDSVNWDSVNWDSVNWDSVNWDSVNWDSVNWDSVNWDSVNWDSVNWDSVNWDSVNWDSVDWGGDYWGN